MRSSDLARAPWRKSSRSVGDGNETNCVEVAELSGRIAVRDSKDPAGAVLAVTNVEWQGFLGGVRAGDFHWMTFTGGLAAAETADEPERVIVRSPGVNGGWRAMISGFGRVSLR